MAWRIDEQILRGELDNTARGRVAGRVWLVGVAEPLVLDLRGDCAPDLAGCVLTFENPLPQPFASDPPEIEQRGWVGDITASQKLRVHDVSMEEVLRCYKLRLPQPPSHWANALYLEWFSERNGRVVVQTAAFTLHISEPAWTLTDEEYRASRAASDQEHVRWMEEHFGPFTGHVEVVNVGDLLAEREAEEEGEEWKRDDDARMGAAADEFEVFDPMEHAEWMPARAILVREGFTPLASGAVEDAQLRGRLWELIYALAARRIFLQCTDHLDDRALYVWLDAFLDEECADCPPEAETNYRVDVSDQSTGSSAGIQTWLRYYADDAERTEWQHACPDTPMPPREPMPYDRDRFLPEPPSPPPAWVPPDDEDDPLGLADVDSEIRIENLKDEIAEAGGGEVTEVESADLPPAIEEAFLEQVRDIERGDWQRPIDQLAAQGAAPLPPDALTDEMLAARLWELLHQLACRGFYVLHTDHLSDRALYTALWKKGLREEAILPGRSQRGAWFHDCIGSYGPEDMQIFHRYYETEESRARHLAKYPNDALPPREAPPFSRDWRLPKGPF